ncbi:MAG: hypothetical protein ACYS6K_18370 [Planctomycetota bacterium]|jgi:hypothetical protein
MKSFIRAITIIIVLALIPTASATAQNSAGIVSEPVASVVDVVESEPTSRTNDAVNQLRTLLSTMSQQHVDGKVLVIPTTQIRPQEMVTLMEDMTVMCRIFDKKLAQSSLVPQTPVWVGLSSTYSLGDRSMGAMYIQGYGALFMINVDFPLTPPPEKERKKEDTEEDTDPVWEQMKQEIFSPQQATRYTSKRQEEQYDATKVKNLKTTLKEALVHAANIRGLKPDESVILTVTGRAISSNFDKVAAIKGTNRVVVHYKDENVTKILKSPSLDDLGISSPTVLTIRAKKSHIDALAQKQIDFDKFEEKIQFLSYPCLGQNIGGRSSSFWPAGATGVDPFDSSSVGRSSRRRGSRSSSRDVMR